MAAPSVAPKRWLVLATDGRGRAYTRQQLPDRVWGRGRRGDPRTVDVHVRWLRSKIEETPDEPRRLITVRGTGYRFDPAPLTDP